jgi:hypothetical protein
MVWTMDLGLGSLFVNFFDIFKDQRPKAKDRVRANSTRRNTRLTAPEPSTMLRLRGFHLFRLEGSA